MKHDEFSNEDVLREIFELPEDWAKALYSIEYCLTKHSISNETNADKKRIKQKWLQNWEEGICSQFNSRNEDKEFSLVCDDAALKEYLKNLNSDTTQRSHAYLIVIESLLFVPYYDLKTRAENGQSSSKVKYSLDVDYLSGLIEDLNIDKKMLERFRKKFFKSWMVLSDQASTIITIAVASGVALALTAGLLAPQIALLFAASGLTGAAAISSGLAALGGGAVATGGFGMLGGITVLVSAGGILGIAGGTAIGALAANSPTLASLIAAKLEVYFRDVVLPILHDPDTARRILRGQESFIIALNKQLELSPNVTDADRKAIKLIEKIIKILQKGLNRNRKALLDYNKNGI